MGGIQQVNGAASGAEVQFLHEQQVERSRVMNQEPSDIDFEGPTPVMSDLINDNKVDILSTNRPKREREIDEAPEKAVKRQRTNEIPIWAQPCKATKPLKKYRSTENQSRNGNGQIRPAPPDAGLLKKTIIMTDGDLGPLGKLGPSFNDVIVSDEITRAICDFLFMHVVNDTTLQTRSAGGPPDAAGLLEIEADWTGYIDGLFTMWLMVGRGEGLD